MAKQPTVKVEYKVINQAFNKGIKEMNQTVNTLNKEFKLQKEEMKNTASESEKLQSSVNKLNKEYDIAQQKTRSIETALQNVKEATGASSNETRIWSDKLLDAKRNEEYLKNAIDDTTKQLEKATEAEKKSTSESEKRKAKLNELKTSQETLKSSSEKLSKEYELQVKQLGKNATESDKAKLKQEYLAKQMKLTADETKNLEQQLALAKEEYGEGSKEVDKLEKELLDAKIANQDFANSFKESTDKLEQFRAKAEKVGGTLKTVGKGMTKYVTAPIVAGVGLSIKAASDFDSAFTGVKKTVDEVKDANGKVIISYADLEKGIRNMAKEIPASTTEISAVAEAAGQLGIKTENVLEFTRTMIDMGQATNLSSEEAASSLAQLANITQMPQDKFDELGSTIVALGNNMATTESDIVAMSLRLAGSAKQAGLTEAQIVALAAAMSSVGINAEAGGGSMSRVMQKINSDVLSGGGNLEKFAKISGMSSSEFQKAWKDDAATAITEFVKGLGRVKESGGDVSGALKDMGINSTQEIDTLLRLSGAGETLADALDLSADAWKENTALTEEAEKRYETFQSKLVIVKNKLADIGIELGGPLMDAMASVLDALEPVIDVVTRMAKSFSEASPAVQKIIIILAAVAAAAGPLLFIIGSIIQTVAALIPIITGVATAIGVSVGVVTAAMAIIPIIIAAVIALVIAIVANWDAIKNKSIEIFNIVKEFIVNTWNSVYTSVSEVVSNLVSWVVGLFNGFKSSTEGVFSSMGEFINNIWTSISTFAVNTWNSLVAFLAPIVQAVVSVINVPISLLQTILSGIWLLMKAGAIIAWEAIKIAASTIWNAIKNSIVNPIQSAWSVVSGKLQEMWSGMVSKFESIRSSAADKFNAVKNAITTPLTNAKNTAVNTASAIWSGITSKFESIRSATVSKFNAVKSAIIDPLVAAKNKVGELIGNIKSFFSNLVLKIPKPSMPSMPSFSLKTSSKTILGKTITYPSGIGVSWNAKGGIFDSPTIIGAYGGKLQGVGEAGPEAVLPLNENTLGNIGKGIANTMFGSKELVKMAEDLVNNISSNQNISIQFNTTVANDYDADALFDKADKWIASKGISKNFGIGKRR